MSDPPLQGSGQPRAGFGGLVGSGPALGRVFALLECAADCDAAVLLGGESGTGKSTAAEAIHAHSVRRRDPLDVVDCTASGFDGGLDPPPRPGTLLLDHVGELDLRAQARLHRALAHEPRRVLAASHRDLRAEVRAQRFRSDLYYRLAVIEIRLPPLREHLEDLPLLVEALLGRAAPALIDDAYLALLGRHVWPGNVRELRHHLEQCLALGERVPIAGRRG